MALTRTAVYPTALLAWPSRPRQQGRHLGQNLVRQQQRQPLLPFEYFGKGNVQLFDDKEYSIRM